MSDPSGGVTLQLPADYAYDTFLNNIEVAVSLAQNIISEIHRRNVKSYQIPVVDYFGVIHMIDCMPYDTVKSVVNKVKNNFLPPYLHSYVQVGYVTNRLITTSNVNGSGSNTSAVANATPSENNDLSSITRIDEDEVSQAQIVSDVGIVDEDGIVTYKVILFVERSVRIANQSKFRNAMF